MSLTFAISGSIPPLIGKTSMFGNVPVDHRGLILKGGMSPRPDAIDPRGTKALLTIIINSSMLMDNDTGHAFGPGATSQCGLGVAQETRPNHGGGSCAGEAAWNFRSAGVSIYWTGARGETSLADSRTQGGLYSQTSHRADPASEAIRPIHRRDFKRHGHAGVGSPSQAGGTWLKEGVPAESRSSTALTGWGGRRLPRSIESWCVKMLDWRTGRESVSLQWEAS